MLFPFFVSFALSWHKEVDFFSLLSVWLLITTFWGGLLLTAFLPYRNRRSVCAPYFTSLTKKLSLKFDILDFVDMSRRVRDQNNINLKKVLKYDQIVSVI